MTAPPGTNGPEPRSLLADIPAYRAGRSAPAGAFKLSSNEIAFPPLPGAVAAAQDALGEANRYPDFGSTRLVAALALRHAVPEEWVTVGTGSVAVLQQVLTAFAGVGDEVVFPWRSFEAYPILTRLTGATAVPVPLLPDEHHDLEGMAAAIGDRTRVVLVCATNNPTGTTVSAAGLDELLRRVPPHVVVVVDEAYVEFLASGGTDASPGPDDVDGVELVRRHRNVVALRTFAKAYGLAGLRVGYGVAPAPIADALRKARLPFGVTAAAEQAALAALAAEGEVRLRVGAVVQERERVLAELRSANVPVTPSRGNFYWLRLGEDAVPFAVACEEAGVVVRVFPGEGVRVSVGEPEANSRVAQVARRWFAAQR